MKDEETMKGSGIVDITDKPSIHRTAIATGSIKLKEFTIKAIRSGQIKKGDVLSTARVAALLAIKETPRLIPYCHQIPITASDIIFEFEPNAVKATATVTSIGMTGVEMEALAGVCAALLNVWDMVKYLEKDDTGNYPTTEICEIKVIEKRKRAV